MLFNTLWVGGWLVAVLMYYPELLIHQSRVREHDVVGENTLILARNQPTDRVETHKRKSEKSEIAIAPPTHVSQLFNSSLQAIGEPTTTTDSPRTSRWQCFRAKTGAPQPPRVPFEAPPQ